MLVTLILVRFQALRDCCNLCSQRSLNSSQPWPTITYVRYSQVDHARTMDIVPLPLGARNEDYKVFSGNSNFMQKALGGTLHSTSYSREAHWRVLNSDS